MKGNRLTIKMLAYAGLVGGFIMVLLNLYPSWSQYAMTWEGPLLSATLFSIASMFLLRADSHPEKDRILFTIFKKDMRLEHINRYTGFFFALVLCTPVTHKEWYIQTLHLIFTALAILTAYLQLWFYYTNDRLMDVSAKLSIAIGLLGFAGGYVFRYYTVGLGELIVALTLIIFILTTNRK